MFALEQKKIGKKIKQCLATRYHGICKGGAHNYQVCTTYRKQWLQRT